MPEKQMIALAELQAMVRAVFESHGVSTDDASAIADVLVWAEASGHASHGVLRVERYLDFIKQRRLDPSAKPHVDKDSGALFRIDAGRSAGAVAMRYAREAAIERVKAHGIALGLVANTTHIGAAGYHAAALAEASHLSIVAAGGVPLMAYHGAATKSLSTAPLSICVPAEGRPALLLDMASSEVALGKIKKAIRDGQTIPEGWALTEEGDTTTDPTKANVLLPMAGPKGSGLALMIECLTGVLAGAPALLGRLDGSASGHTQNVMVLVVDIDRLCDLSNFKREVSALASMLEAQPRAQGFSEILMPGARSAQARAAAEKDGVELTVDALTKLKQLAKRA